MTLVLSSHSALPANISSSHHDSMRWSPMTPTIDVPTHSTLGLPSHNYASSASSSNAAGSTPTALRKTSGGQIKKRASRAGTRSVSTLSAAQLERKRANDREAQRAIRQRTKDHIDGLEATLNDVKQTLENREKLLAASHSRNRELEEENAMLRMRLSEANLPTTLPQKFQRPSDPHNMSAPPSAVSEASGSISQRSGSNAAAVNNFNIQNSNMTNNANGWVQSQQAQQQQQQHANTFTPANGLVLSADQDAARNVPGWRARDSPSAVHSTTNPVVPPGVHPPQALPFTPTGERPTWSSVSHQYEFGSAAAQQAAFQQQQSQHVQQDTHFTQTPTSAYPPTPRQQQQQQQPAFHPPLMPPQHDFQGMPVNNNNFYPYPQEGFPAQQQYQNAGPAPSPGYQASQAQVQPPPASTTSFRTTGAEQAFNHSFHPPMQFRDEADFRAFNMAHFAPG